LPDSGGESSEDIIPGPKKNHRNKSIEALIPVSAKRFGHYDGYKMYYPRNYKNKKHNPNNIMNQICKISTQIIKNFEQ
jgi:hypothetical protein